MKQLRKQLDQAENRILVLEAKAKYAEEESLRKAEEVPMFCLFFYFKMLIYDHSFI